MAHDIYLLARALLVAAVENLRLSESTWDDASSVDRQRMCLDCSCREKKKEKKRKERERGKGKKKERPEFHRQRD